MMPTIVQEFYCASWNDEIDEVMVWGNAFAFSPGIINILFNLWDAPDVEMNSLLNSRDEDFWREVLETMVRAGTRWKGRGTRTQQPQ
ncbi:hypothetical protein OC713_02410 [Sweet potato little leaf phytoplasma]|nr:hypothetical protein [Sweet potato little leaf phytoplasma]